MRTMGVMTDELRDQFQEALADIVRSATVAEYEEAMARADALAGQLRQRDKRDEDAG